MLPKSTRETTPFLALRTECFSALLPINWLFAQKSAIFPALVASRFGAVRENRVETVEATRNGESWERSMTAQIPTGAEKLIRCLEREGVEYIFGLSGGAAMPMFDALVDSTIQLVMVRHEQGATHMADGYARATGRPGVVLVTSGPGATNTVTGMLTALMDSVPIIVLCGQTIRPMLGKDAFQEADVTGITYPVVKHSYLVKDAADIPRVVREAFHIATTGRPGPVLIDLPKDVTQGPCDAPFVDDVDLPGYTVPTRARPEDLTRAAELLRAAKRPLLYVGHGAVISGAGKAVISPGREAARAHREHPARQGRRRRDPSAAPRHARHARHRLREQGGGRVRPASWPSAPAGTTASPASSTSSARTPSKIHIDIDPSEFNKMIRPDVADPGRRAARARGAAAR